MSPRLSRLVAGVVLALGLVAAAVAAVPAPHTLYLVRHGNYEHTPKADERVADGLNPLGREQAALVAERLASLGVHFDAITSSELTRARETGDVIAARLGEVCGRDGALNETTPPGIGVDPASVDRGAERQLEQAWEFYARPAADAPRHDLLVCHGNVIRWFVCRALGTDPRLWRRLDIANASLTVITIQPDGSARLEVFSDVGHLPGPKQTWTGHGPGWPLARSVVK